VTVLTIDHLLDDALLAKDHDVPADVVPYEDTAYPDDDWPPKPAPHGKAEDTAARGLRIVCEAFINSLSAPQLLADFVTDQIPAPRGARILGCVLMLAESETGARFWWQYAAGAGDDTASYCLYLHHLSQGETHAAAFWRRQTAIDTRPDPTIDPLPPMRPPLTQHDCGDGSLNTVDASTPTLLRVIALLLADPAHPAHLAPARSAFASAVLKYVPDAVAAGYSSHPDVEIPLPGPYFADHLAALAATTTAPTQCRARSREPGLRRRPRPTPSRTAQA
jgi:hypothetical protein